MKTLHLESRSWLKLIGVAAIALVAMVSVVLLQRSRLDRGLSNRENSEQAVQQEKIQLEILKQAPTFGFDNIISDWVFLNFLEYYGDDEARGKTGYALSPDYFDVITRRDPRFSGAYIFLSNSVSYQAGKPEVAIDLMRRGTKVLSPEIDPRAFQVWRFMSLDQLLLLGDIPGAVNSLEKAANWVEETPYADLQASFRQTAKFLRQDPNSKPIRVAAWGSIYEQAAATGDQQTQARAKREIVSLGGRIFEKDGKLYIQPPAPVKKTK